MEEQSNNKSKYEYIKAQQMFIEEKRKAVEIEKKNKAKLELEQRILEEQQLKDSCEVIYLYFKIRVKLQGSSKKKLKY